jgi:hypothetical protein
MRRGLAGISIAAVLIAGCSAEVSSRPNSPEATPAPTATTLTEAQAAETYAALVGEYVKARDACAKAGEVEPPSLADLKAACRKTAEAGRKLSLALQDIASPLEIQPLIDRRAEAAAADQVVCRRVLDSESIEEFAGHVREFSDDSSAVDELIRQKLGLPAAG